MLKSLAKRVLPWHVLHFFRDLPSAVRDWLGASQAVAGIPPLRLMYDGPRDIRLFRENGAEALRFYREVLDLRPNVTMLDIGSGIGRKTLPLTRYLSDQALYVGLEIDRRGVEWCTQHITGAHPRFAFIHLDIHNAMYNPRGKIDPERVIFPFPDASFDLVVLWSVFTHLLPRHLEHYLDEVARLLRPGGRLCSSFYLLTPHAHSEIRAGRAQWKIVHDMGEFWTTFVQAPEDLTAYEEHRARALMKDRALRIREPIMYGGWSNSAPDGRFPNLNAQDIIIAEKI
jgi:SAM-dependent methyltransferase